MAKDIMLNRDLGFLRMGAAIPKLRAADVDFNVNAIIESIRQAKADNIQVLAFPEMAVTGYTLGDLVLHRALLDKARQGLLKIARESAASSMLIIVGLPVANEQKVFNCAAAVNGGQVLGIVPKTYLPAYREFYELRWFASGNDARSNTIEIDGEEVPFGTDLLFRLNGMEAATVGIELCEDLWVPLAPHEHQALSGATVLVNLSASNELLGKAEWRRTMVASESGRCIAAYCYVSSGIGESSNDVVFSGHALLAENGTILKESARLSADPQLIYADIDTDRLEHDRRTMTSFNEAASQADDFDIIETEVADFAPAKLERAIDPHPFVPSDKAARAERCREIFSMQVAALAQKLNGAHQQRLMLGISGGLDSTLALLAAAKTMDFLGLPRTNVYAYNLPGFGTTAQTKGNASKLCRALGVTFETVNVTATSKQHLKDLEHGGNYDVVYENVQARYRTDFLFNKANQMNGILLGTGDLTEVALGWSTFSGDQLSHYHVNVSVPKTLVKYLVQWVADEEDISPAAKKALYSVLATPISPELLPAVNGEIVQKSEDTIGPVELADFFLYPFIRFGMRPGKILWLADEVNKQGLFDTSYTPDELYKWSKSFLTRFFANQFKRTCIPEGPKIASVSLSPRGDWRMPSEAQSALWLEDLEGMKGRIADSK